MGKKEEILNATFTLFAKKGYDTSMSDIANEVGIKVPSLYSHFKNKDEIIYLTIQREIENYLEVLLNEIKLDQRENSEIRLKKICFSITSYFRNLLINRFWKNIMLINQDEVKTKCKEMVVALEIEVFQEVTSIIEKGIQKEEIKKGDVEGYAYLYTAMIQGILNALLIYHDSELDMDILIEKIWNTYWDGIKTTSEF